MTLTNSGGVPILGSINTAVPLTVPHISTAAEKPFSIYVGTAGDLAVKLGSAPNDEVVFKNVMAGTVFVGDVKEVTSNTTATDLLKVR